MNNSPVQKNDKACSERIKEIAKGSGRLALVWLAALVLVWATKIEPSFGPVIRYQNAVTRKKTAEKDYKKEQKILKGKIKSVKISPDKPGGPVVRWEFLTKEEMTQATVTAQEGVYDKIESSPTPTPSPTADEDEAEQFPTYDDQDHLKKLNLALNTLTQISIEAEARKVSATSVDFELLTYKFASSVLYAPLVWNCFFLGLLIYLYLTRKTLIRLLIRHSRLTKGSRLYDIPWWINPLPHWRSDRYIIKQMHRATGWSSKSRSSSFAVGGALVFALLLQARVAKTGLEITKTLGSGNQAHWLTAAYYIVFLLFLIFLLFWLPPRYYRPPSEGNKI